MPVGNDGFLKEVLCICKQQQPSTRDSLFRGRVSVVCALALTLTLYARAQSISVPAVPVPPTLFDLNINHFTHGVWPIEHFASFRTFAFRWFKVEPQPGVWDFSETDREVRLAEQHGVTPLPLLMGVPQWADQTSDPANSLVSPDPLERGRQRSMPRDLAAWATYIRIVATRYKGRIHAYELWNEPETNNHFREHPEDLVKLDAIAYRVLHQVDPTIIVASPALSSGDPVPERVLRNLTNFAAAGLYRYCDVVAYHPYLVPERPADATVPPEAIFADTARLRSVLRANHVPDLPLWNTEIGWQVLNDDANNGKHSQWLGDSLTPALTTGFVARTYLLGWAAGWQRIYWYAWNVNGMGLTEANGSYKISEGAYNHIHDWLVGQRLISLDRHKDGSWIAALSGPGGHRSWIVWNESVHGQVSVPAAWHTTSSTDLLGLRTPIHGQAEISPLPVLLQ